MSRRFLLCWKLSCVLKCAGSKDESDDHDHMALCVVPEKPLVDPRYMRAKRKRAEKTVRMVCISECGDGFGMCPWLVIINARLLELP